MLFADLIPPNLHRIFLEIPFLMTYNLYSFSHRSNPSCERLANAEVVDKTKDAAKLTWDLVRKWTKK